MDFRGKIVDYAKMSGWAVLSILILQVVVYGAKLIFTGATYIYTPFEILGKLPYCLRNGLLVAIGETAGRTIIGFTVATILGVSIGVVMGRIGWMRKAIRPYIDFLRTMPSSALVPIVVMIVGYRELSYQLIIIYGGVWPILLSALEGTSKVHVTSGGVMRQMNMGKWNNLRWFVLPEAASEIVTGLRISLSVCLILSVTAEIIIGQNTGLGAFISDTSRSGRLPESYLGVISIAVIGLLMNGLFFLAEQKFPWLVNQDEKAVEDV